MPTQRDNGERLGITALEALDALRHYIQRAEEFSHDSNAHMLAAKATRMSNEIESWILWRRREGRITPQ